MIIIIIIIGVLEGSVFYLIIWFYYPIRLLDLFRPKSWQAEVPDRNWVRYGLETTAVNEVIICFVKLSITPRCIGSIYEWKLNK